MKLYVANTTKQNFEFAYRIPEVNGVKVQSIRMGTQIRVPLELNSVQLDEILSQHRKYGMVAADEVDRTKPFIGYCYSIDTPVRAANIAAALEHNQEVLRENGRQMRKEAAVASNNLIDSHLHEAQVDATLQNFEVTITEEDRKGRVDGEDLLQEGLLVSQHADEHDGKPVNVDSGYRGNANKQRSNKRPR